MSASRSGATCRGAGMLGASCSSDCDVEAIGAGAADVLWVRRSSAGRRRASPPDDSEQTRALSERRPDGRAGRAASEHDRAKLFAGADRPPTGASEPATCRAACEPLRMTSEGKARGAHDRFPSCVPACHLSLQACAMDSLLERLRSEREREAMGVWSTENEQVGARRLGFRGLLRCVPA